jgi:hypothetical protein
MNKLIEIHGPPSQFGELNSPAAIAYLEFVIEFLRTPLEKNQDLSTYFRAAVYSISFLSSEDPSRFHYQVAREILREAGGADLEREEKARDLLVRELFKECQKLASHFLPIQDSKIEIAEEKIFTSGGRLCLDELFSQHIARIGPHGKKLGEALLAASEIWRQAYLKDQNALALFRLWVDFDIPPYYCRYLKLLAEILWKDRVESQFQKNQKHPPALTQSVQRPITRLLSSRAEILENNGKTTVFYEGKTIADIALIDPLLSPLMSRGIESLDSIYHHKLLRYECKTGYENWIDGHADPRLLRFERGETEIAEILGFKFKEAPKIIKSLLQAQAHMTFYFDDASQGNLISLREFRSPNTNREEGLEIVLGTQLMPYYTFQTDRRGRLLVPLPDLPPLVSAPQYHAGQALLQMLIMDEFSQKSIELATRGNIEIIQEKWDDFLKQTALPPSVFKKVRSRWLADGDDGPKFLAEVEKNRYTLGEHYGKEYKFLRSQGLMRKNRQQQGQVSVRKRLMSQSRG